MGLMPLRHSYGGSRKYIGASVPVPMTLSLCLACLLVGYMISRFSPQYQACTQAHEPQAANIYSLQQQQPQQQTPHLPQSSAPPATAKDSQTVAPPAVGHLPNMEEFSQSYLQQSGLLQLRPPLTPAKSGNNFYTVIPYQILSWYPRILVYPNFIDDASAQHIISLAKRRMAPSGLAWRRNEQPDDNQQVRTSSGVFLASDDDQTGTLSRIEAKIAQVTLLPPSHGEAFNVLRYELNQKYDSHMDTFDPKDFGPQYSQRMATMLLYLSDVEEGGETIFKREGRNGDRISVTDWASCEENAFKYKPRKGDAVLFYSLDPDLQINPRALHGGCPVTKGEKWVATRWMHEKPLKTSNLEKVKSGNDMSVVH